jgi:hypothetical protein
VVLLDTNVLSELMRAEPDRAVFGWVNDLPRVETCISAITVAEIRLGVLRLPEGKRKVQVLDRAERILDGFSHACLAFDVLAAREYADIVSARRRAGRPIDVQHAQIAAIARSAGMMLATRNVKDFEGIDGLKVVSPWRR